VHPRCPYQFSLVHSDSEQLFVPHWNRVCYSFYFSFCKSNDEQFFFRFVNPFPFCFCVWYVNLL
jgi:hypothetical protein